MGPVRNLARRQRSIEAEPRAAEEQAKIWEPERFVRAGRTNQSGLKLLSAEADAGGVTWFMATITLGQVRRFLRDTGCDVTVQPVIDPQTHPPLTAAKSHGASVTPCSSRCRPAAFRMRLQPNAWTSTTRSPTAHRRGGPPGQTGVATLGPLIRFEHRVKTHGRWRVRQPEPGVWIWRSPHDAHYLVGNAGAYNLGDGPFARRVWPATVPPDAAPSETE